MLPNSDTKEVKLAGLKVAIATPSYGNQVTVEYMRSICATFYEFAKVGIHVHLFTASYAILVKSRNVLTKMFLDSDAEYLFFIDSDMGWDAKDAVRLIAGAQLADHKVAAAAGPQKTEQMRFCTQMVYPVQRNETSGFLKALSVGTAFMLIKREVLEEMAKKAPTFNAANGIGGMPVPSIFETKIEDGEFWSEDYLFCRKYVESGGEVWVEPFVNLKHVGDKIYSGKLIDDLTKLFAYVKPIESGSK